MRKLRSELMSILTVLAVTVAVALTFPFGAVGFRPRPDRARPRSSAAFVVMSADEQATAMRAAKTSWQVDAGGVRRLRVDLSVGELPEDPAASSMDIGVRPSRSVVPTVGYQPSAYPLTQAAAPCAGISRAEAEPVREPPFPKAELLKLD